MNLKHTGVSAHKSVWYSVLFGVFFYVSIGIFGGLGFEVDSNTNLMQAMYHSPLPAAGLGWVTFIYILFPILTYITSIPVAMIVVKLNFLAAKICTEGNTCLQRSSCILRSLFAVLNWHSLANRLSGHILRDIHFSHISIDM
jgi:putative exporter of polyketide antibiotics